MEILSKKIKWRWVQNIRSKQQNYAGKTKITLTNNSWMSQKLSVMRLYSAQTCTHGFIQYIPIISVVIGTFSDLLYMEFYRTIFCEHLLLFPLLKIVMQFLLNHKTKQHWLYKFVSTIVHKNIPNSLWKKAQCRNP